MPRLDLSELNTTVINASRSDDVVIGPGPQFSLFP